MSIAEKLTTIAENEQKVYEAGQKSEYDRFWDDFQNYGNRRTYTNTFGGNGWSDESYNPKYPIIATGGNAYAFWNSELTDTKVDITVGDNVGAMGSFFNGAKKLVTIRKIIVNEGSAYSSWFSNCSALENITFEGTIGKTISFSACSKLTNESVQSIIDHLKDLTGLTSVELTFHKTVGSKLTEAQKAAITAKNWTLVY